MPRPLIKKMLEGGVDDQKALANQLTDPRYKEFVTDFNFERYGTATNQL